MFVAKCTNILAFHSEPPFFSCVRSPDQHLQRWSCPQPGGKAHPGKEFYNPRWYVAFLSAGEASGATYTGPAHTGNHKPSPCERWCPVHTQAERDRHTIFGTVHLLTHSWIISPPFSLLRLWKSINLILMLEHPLESMTSVLLMV